MTQVISGIPLRMKSITLSVVLGDNEAEILQQLQYWLDRTEKDAKHFIDGQVWIWKTYDDWHYQDFPSISKATIKRALSNLIDWGLVLRGEFNDSATDRTLWYSIDQQALKNLETYLDTIFKSYHDPLKKERKDYIEHLKRIGIIFRKAISDRKTKDGAELSKRKIESIILIASSRSFCALPDDQNDHILPETTPETTPEIPGRGHNGTSKRKQKPTIPKEFKDPLFESICTHLLDTPYVKGETKVPTETAIRASDLSKIAYLEFTPPITPDEIKRFAQDWRSNHPTDFNMPTSDSAFTLNFTRWRGKQSPNGHQPSFGGWNVKG